MNREGKRIERIRTMERVVRELRNRQTVFEVFSDAEFFESPYGADRRAKNQKAENLIYLHVLVPGTGKSLFEAYFERKYVKYAIKKEIKDFDSLQTEIPFLPRIVKGYLECSIDFQDNTEMYERAVAFSLDLMNYAIKKYPEYDPNHTWSFGTGINVPLAPKRVIKLTDGSIHYVCGNCELEFKEAPRCPDCGQLVKTPED